jgi:hypothetical protein
MSEISGQFNDLYLPVQWIRDETNPGKLDKGELWVHPSLSAYNEYCSQQGSGCKPIDPKKIADVAVKYLKLPENKRIKHPLLTKDLATRRRIRFNFDFASVPKGPKKTALKALVKAAALSGLYFNLQWDPNYAKQFQTLVNHVTKKPGDMLRLVHFAQFSRQMCLNDESKDCSPLKGLGLKIDNNGALWPEGFTKADIDFLKGKSDEEKKALLAEGRKVDEYKWPSESIKRKVMTPRSRIIECKAGDPDAFNYKEKWYRPVSINSENRIRIAANMIATHLETAARALTKEDPGLSRVLSARAADMRSSPVYNDPEMDRVWAALESRDIITAFGRVETYEKLASHYGVKSGMQSVVAYVDPELKKFNDGVTKVMGELDARIWQLWESKGEEFPLEKKLAVPPKAAFVNVVINDGMMNSPAYVPAGFNQPNSDNYALDIPPDQQVHKLALFGPILSARVQNQGLPIAKKIFDAESVRNLEAMIPDVISTTIYVQGHEFAHSHIMGNSDSLFVPRLGRKIKFDDVVGKHLGDSFEEAKADLLGIYDLEHYHEKGLITKTQWENALWAHVGSLLRDFNLGAKDEHGRGAIMEFYLLCKPEYGIFIYDKATGRYRVDMNKMKANAGAVAKDFMDVYLSFNRSRAKGFDKAAQEFLASSPMGRAVKAVQKEGLPGDNLPYYRLNNFTW